MPDLDTTLLRQGRAALSYTDMLTFAETVESRPIIKLLEELPGIAALSDSKFRLASTILRRRFRGEAPVHQLQLRIIAGEIASAVNDAEIAHRIRSIFAYDEA
jgi:hypothetical protein